MSISTLERTEAPSVRQQTESLPVIDWSSISTNSTNSTNSTPGGTFHHPAVYPPNTIIADYMGFATCYLESADCYVLGSIMAAIASILGRRVSFVPWTNPLYPNLFVMLAGKPADRKSTAIRFAEKLLRRVIDPISFLPSNFSPESLFDAYDIHAGGCPDKILIADEANIILTDWRTTGNGERNANRFLKLYDCTGDSESFKRNLPGGRNSVRTTNELVQDSIRVIPETSTSVIFGATFQSAFFQGQSVRGGIERRFLYYIGTRHARLIELPIPLDVDEYDRLVESFATLRNLEGAITLSEEARLRWREVQIENRRKIDELMDTEEAKSCRLGGVPTHILKVAMIFQAARWAKIGGDFLHIDREILDFSVNHVEACMNAIDHGSIIGNQAGLSRDAEVILAQIRSRFPNISGSHYVTKSMLTQNFCRNPNRDGAMKPETLYREIIPHLVRSGMAYIVPRESNTQKQFFAFRPEGI